jgi:hypothetical protein
VPSSIITFVKVQAEEHSHPVKQLHSVPARAAKQGCTVWNVFRNSPASDHPRLTSRETQQTSSWRSASDLATSTSWPSAMVTGAFFAGHATTGGPVKTVLQLSLRVNAGCRQRTRTLGSGVTPIVTGGYSTALCRFTDWQVYMMRT